MGTTYTSRSRAFRGLTLALALCLFLSILPPVPLRAASASALSAMEQLNQWGVLKGYPSGGMQPDRPVTRAEFVAMMNRAYGFTDMSNPKKFSDVPENAWYADEFAIASTAGYFKGTSGSTASPNNRLSREDAMVLLAKCMRLEQVSGEVTEFTDGRTFGSWSRGYVKAAVKQGIIKGYSDGSFRPKNAITRAEMSQLLVRSIGTLVNGGGEQVLGDVYGTVTVNQPGTVLKDTRIAGDLYITGGLGTGAVTLDNVVVTGKIIIAGGGEAEAGNDSVILRNVEAENLTVDTTNGQYVSLRAEGDTSIKNALLRTNAFVQDRTDAGYGLLNLTLNGRTDDPQFSLSGNLKDIVNLTPDSTVNISAGTAQSFMVDETAIDSSLNIGNDATVRELNLDAATNVTGTGDIGKVTVGANGSTITMLPDTIDVRPGVTANIYGQDMDNKLGLESSADPRILASYPIMRQVAPTSAQAVFSCNKAGTLYWAVSAVNDGTLTEDELITPAAYASKAVKQGNLKVSNANAEIAAAISGLTKGGTYYLSAMLVDNRGTRSPIKVASFGTPDDTVPNFAQGFPALSKITHNAVQLGAMTTKDCLLYYVVLPKGAAAPTVADFKSGAIPGNLGFGSREMTKNVSEYFYLERPRESLEELAEYDVYLWLTDANGAKSSSVKKLSFKTIDGTPPVFTTDLTLISPKSNALTCITTVNEDATVFWVAVKTGTEYPKPQNGSSEKPALSSYEAKVAVANGKGIGSTGKNGKATVKGDVETTLNINGLQPETAYDIYYVAQDKAGNYSEVVKVLRDVHTLDNAAPTVTQRFDHFSEEFPDNPYADTNVEIVFNETVCRNSKDPSLRVPLLSLYENVQAAATPAQDLEARRQMAEVLSSVIHLYSTSSRDPVPARKYDEAGNPENTDDWVIDFRNAEIMMDDSDPEGRRMLIRLYGTDNDINHPQGINLKSGATYYFTVEDIADTSDNFNAMNDVRLPNFTTISAQAYLEDSDTLEDIVWVDANGVTGTCPADRIDLAFSMTPISASTVEDNVKWDMILWSDSTVKYDLFFKRPHDTVWTKANSGTTTGDIFVPSGSKSYVGNSLYRTLMRQNDYPALNTLEDDQKYEYVISITAISDSGIEERNSWNQLVNFRVQVLTGSKRPLDNQKLNIYEVGESLTDISAAKKLPYTISKQFTDAEAPDFTRGYPMFFPKDETMTMQLQLTRPGYVFYVIAPAFPQQYVETKDLNGNDVEYDDNSIPHMQVSGSLYPQNTKFPVSSPTLDQVSDDPATNFSNPLTKYGNKRVGEGTEDITITGLQPNTKYFAYFVIQGEADGGPAGARSQHVLLYKFETVDVIRPILTLNVRTNPNVNVKSDIDAQVEYLLVTYDTTYMPELLTAPFRTTIPGYEYVLPENRGDRDGGYEVEDKYEDYFLSRYLREDYTILNALNEDVVDNNKSLGSVYDLFAGMPHKISMASFIRGAAGEVTDVSVGGDSTTLQADKEVAVNCNKPPIQMSPLPSRYIFLAVGRSSSNTASNMSSGDAFKATYSVYLKGDDKPMVLNILSDLTYDPVYKTVSGKLTLLFNHDLYYFNSQTHATQTIDNGLIDDVRRTSDSSYISIASRVTGNSTGFNIETNSGSYGRTTNQIVFNLNSVSPSGSAVIGPNLCDESGQAVQTTSLSIQLQVDRETGEVIVKIPSAFDGRETE